MMGEYNMSKRWLRISVSSIILIAVFGGFLFLVKQSNIRSGFGVKDERELKLGNYDAEEIEIEGEYAVVAISGNGTFRITDQNNREKRHVTLDDRLYNDVHKQTPQIVNQALYEEGEKIEIAQADTLIVEGDDTFIIKLIKK